MTCDHQLLADLALAFPNSYDEIANNNDKSGTDTTTR